MQPLRWEHQRPKSRSTCARVRRTPSPLPCKWSHSRSPVSFRTAPSFREALGSSLPYTGAAAAQQDDLLPGRGLYVPMQRGLEARGTSRPPVRSEGAAHSARGTPTTPSAFVLPAGGGQGDEEAITEPWGRDAAPSGRSGIYGGLPAGSSFEQHEALHAWQQVPAAPSSWGSGGSFLLGTEAGFVTGRDSGSFYGVRARGDPRFEALRAAGAPPPLSLQASAAASPPPPAQPPSGTGTLLPAAPAVRGGASTPSFYVRADGHLAAPAARVPPPLLQRHTTQAVVGPAMCYGPAFIAVNG